MLNWVAYQVVVNCSRWNGDGEWRSALFCKRTDAEKLADDLWRTKNPEWRLLKLLMEQDKDIVLVYGAPQIVEHELVENVKDYGIGAHLEEGVFSSHQKRWITPEWKHIKKGTIVRFSRPFGEPRIAFERRSLGVVEEVDKRKDHISVKGYGSDGKLEENSSWNTRRRDIELVEG